jgi:hypothetical protein
MAQFWAAQFWAARFWVAQRFSATIEDCKNLPALAAAVI